MAAEQQRRRHEATHRSRYTDEAAAAHEKSDRAEAESEIVFSPKEAMAGMLYELLPCPVGGLVCLLGGGGWVQATNRLLLPRWPPYPQAIADWVGFSIATTAAPAIVLIVFTALSGQSGANSWEVVLAYALTVIRAATIGCKYGFFGDKDQVLIRTNRDYLTSIRYIKKQGITWAMNGSDALHEVLLEELCLLQQQAVLVRTTHFHSKPGSTEIRRCMVALTSASFVGAGTWGACAPMST